MTQVSFEIVTSDPDLKEITATWYDGTTIFIRQVDTGDHIVSQMYNQEEAKQLHAVLESFINHRLEHTSDCALFNSPAYPIEKCTCKDY